MPNMEDSNGRRIRRAWIFPTYGEQDTVCRPASCAPVKEMAHFPAELLGRKRIPTRRCSQTGNGCSQPITPLVRHFERDQLLYPNIRSCYVSNRAFLQSDCIPKRCRVAAAVCAHVLSEIGRATFSASHCRHTSSNDTRPRPSSISASACFTASTQSSSSSRNLSASAMAATLNRLRSSSESSASRDATSSGK
jgi:hypothetical protein